jgi:hypothetical protein
MTSTREVARWTAGTSTSGSPAYARATAAAWRPRARSRAPRRGARAARRRAAAARGRGRRARRPGSCRHGADVGGQRLATPGYCTFTATGRPSAARAGAPGRCSRRPSPAPRSRQHVAPAGPSSSRSTARRREGQRRVPLLQAGERLAPRRLGVLREQRLDRRQELAGLERAALQARRARPGARGVALAQVLGDALAVLPGQAAGGALGGQCRRSGGSDSSGTVRTSRAVVWGIRSPCPVRGITAQDDERYGGVGARRPLVTPRSSSGGGVGRRRSGRRTPSTHPGWSARRPRDAGRPRRCQSAAPHRRPGLSV